LTHPLLLTLRVCLSSPRHAPQNSEIFTLTYGALVVQLIKDYEDYSAVNVQLDKMYIPPFPPYRTPTLLGVSLES
jgi:hypothetical protein